MKKVIISIVLVSMAIVFVYSMVYYRGVYFSFGKHDEESKVLFWTEGKTIQHRGKMGGKEEMVIKGVNVDTFLPGHNPSEYFVTKETWLRWFEEIQEMGANTIRTYTIYNDVFYDALFEYNYKNTKPLYLLQGIQVNEYANNNARDAYAEEFYYELYTEAEMAVDVIHGRRNIPDSDTRGFGVFRLDVSPWVIGYIVGTDWNANTIEYTNHNGYDTSYAGEYLSTENADAFETLLCKVMDRMVYYEADKYREQRLITFVNDPLYDPLEYDMDYAVLYGKFSTLDAEHIMQKEGKYSGLFASYNIYTLCEDYAAALTNEMKERLGDVLSTIGSDVYLNGYVDLLSAYHTVPVVISSYECSTSRGVTESHLPVNEQEQGRQLMAAYDHMREVGCSGAFIECWQDSWVKRSFNTTYAMDLTHAQNWQDPQTVSQSKGIMAFVPENAYGNCYIDGDFSDFDGAPVATSTSEYVVKYSYDTNYLYFYIQGKSDLMRKKAYLVFDVTPNSGVNTYVNEGLTFDAPVDFVLRLNGPSMTRLMVQERYDSLRENYMEVLSKRDPYEQFPGKDKDRFVTIGMLWQRNVGMDIVLQSNIDVVRFTRFESGKMNYGISNPESEEFDSLADFYFGDCGVEVRIPWTLFNFSDPSRRYIHDDYYEHYGRENLQIDDIKIGVGDEEHKDMTWNPVSLPTWDTNIVYEERLKASYAIIKENWGRK